MLVSSGIKPYYLFQLDEAQGLQHFKVRLERGIEIMRIVRRDCSGLALPQYVVDIPGGLGKVPLDHLYIKTPEATDVIVENAEGRFGVYENNAEESRCMKCGICSI
jgi:lysine 2,3-aminomutase